MVYEWELEKVKDWETNDIKNRIWAAVESGIHKRRRKKDDNKYRNFNCKRHSGFIWI